jgi:hypothetical protein
MDRGSRFATRLGAEAESRVRQVDWPSFYGPYLCVGPSPLAFDRSELIDMLPILRRDRLKIVR